jgi:hypothetical protein
MLGQQGQQMLRKEQRSESAYIIRLREAAIASGLPAAEVDRILAPVRAARVTQIGDSADDFRKAQERAERDIQHKVSVEVKMSPQAKGYFDVTNPSYSESLKGLRGRQGTTRTP